MVLREEMTHHKIV